MAKGPINTATDTVKNLGTKNQSNQKKLLDRYAKNLKAKLEKDKKYINDKEKLEQVYNQKVQNFKKKLNKESLEETKHRLNEEAKYAISSQEKVAKKTKALGIAALQNLSKVAKTTFNALDRGIENYLGTYSQYMGLIESRLQGSTKNFSSVTSLISNRIGASQYVSQTKVLSNLSAMIEQGINYNVEQRAFLQTISENIANTFDAFDSNLLRIIRLQQSDTTAARLGLEANLIKFFNTNFSDTSYLSDAFKNVRSNLFEAESQLGRNESVAFEYNIQKWLGSLYSVGVSSNTISSLSQGLGYLGSGNISALSGNEALQRLLVAASNAAGLNYGGLLTKGLNAGDANKLLKGVVDVIQQISQSNNQVVRSQYANLFGITISDMSAIASLTDKVQSIANTVLDYNGAIQETESQIKALPSRLSIQTRIDNMFSNVMAGIGENIANSAAAYTTWMLTDLIQKSGVDLSVTAFGTKVDPIAIAKGAIIGLSTLGELGTILAGLTGANNLSLSNWGAQDTLTAGGAGFTGVVSSGVSQTTSQSYFIGNTSSGFYEQASSKAQAAEAESITGQKQDEQLQIIRDSIAPNVAAILTALTLDGIIIKGTSVPGLTGTTI